MCFVGAIAFGEDIFPSMGEEDPKLNQLNCIGNEDSIRDCSSNTVGIETCSSAVALCQGRHVCQKTFIPHSVL